MVHLTPLDIRKQQFKKKMSGYDPDEVDAFLDMMANEFETLLQAIAETKQKNDDLNDELKEYKSIDRELRDTLIMVKQLKESTRAEVAKEADLLVQQAEAEADSLVRQARIEKKNLAEKIEQLKTDQESIEIKARAMTKTLRRLLQVEESAGPEISLDLEKMAETDSEILMQDRLHLLRDVRSLYKEKEAYIARLKNLFEMQNKLFDLNHGDAAK